MSLQYLAKKAALIPLFVMAALIAPHTVFAQAQAGINFRVAVPQGNFADSIDGLGYGIGLDAMYMPASVGFGLSASYLVYGTESRRAPWSETIPDAYLNVDRTYSILQLHFLMRAEYKRGDVRPYIDGLIGFNYLAATTDVRSDNYSDQAPITSTTNYDDIAFSYGGGGGFLIRVYTPKEGESDGLRNVFIDLGARYIVGSEARYVTPGNFRVSNGRVEIITTKSKTDLLNFHIGVTVDF